MLMAIFFYIPFCKNQRKVSSVEFPKKQNRRLRFVCRRVTKGSLGTSVRVQGSCAEGKLNPTLLIL